MRFDDALHEFGTIQGVKEDVTDIILNLKDLVLRDYSDEPVSLRLDKRGPGAVTAGDIQTTADVDPRHRSLRKHGERLGRLRSTSPSSRGVAHTHSAERKKRRRAGSASSRSTRSSRRCAVWPSPSSRPVSSRPRTTIV